MLFFHRKGDFSPSFSFWSRLSLGFLAGRETEAPGAEQEAASGRRLDHGAYLGLGPGRIQLEMPGEEGCWPLKVAILEGDHCDHLYS